MAVNIFRIGNAIILWAMIIFFLPKRSFKRYLPVTLFTSCILLIETLLNLIFKWWKVKGGTKFIIFDDLAFIFGPFFTINLWIFHFTYGKFSLYALTNLVMDLLFAFPLNALFQRIGHYKLKKLNSFGLFLTYYALSFLNYGFQKFLEKPNSPETH
ncbi:hypothetical protein [Cytobacillus purgationiresistens]|uniref:Uncharacterized protein n=1 Tax=Cytobacillus purgationiresistens TaxID=863449 RepID=A0ABU0AI75_9BACI|nr:hypothetical protein [Cytobacillus purgationiresistens]MDQ0270957.1 hypothetical protein [Cytobacillus purgationiresistens]